MLPLILLALPVAEITGFILVGGAIGLLPTLGLIATAAVIGLIVLRIQGLGLLAQIRGELERGVTPGRELADRAMILLGGLLLLVPGFVSDALGLLLFLPPVRRALLGLVMRRVDLRTIHPDTAGRARPRPVTIDLASDDYARQPDTRSPWNEGRRG